MFLSAQTKTKMSSENLMYRICCFLITHPEGATRDDLQIHFKVPMGSINARISDLMKLNRVVLTKEKRNTSSGTKATIVKINRNAAIWLSYSSLKEIKRSSKSAKFKCLTDEKIDKIIDETLKRGGSRAVFKQVIMEVL